MEEPVNKGNTLKKALLKQELDVWLNDVDYGYLTDGDYVPSEFALMFMNFIKLVNGEVGESHKTPPVHLAMLDKMVGDSPFVANLCFRGAAKTTLFVEYMILYIAVFEGLPNFGEISGMIFVGDSMDNGVKNVKKNIKYRYENSEFLKYWLPDATFTDNYLEFTNRRGHSFGVKMFGARTGLRGSKIFAKRPTLAVLDDLVGDEAADSQATMDSIKDTVYKGVFNALDPTKRKIVFNGTPFNKEDILVQAVESGGWDVNVWPVCEKFPCTKEEFRGAWPDRFPYEKVKETYDFMLANGKIPAFLQEMMLRIIGDDNRMVMDAEIKWYSRTELLKYKNRYNFYITTDIATSDKDKANRSVISVWAYNSNGDWFWVDGIVHRKTINHTWDELFRLVSEYAPVGVGIEVSGQQGAYINTLQTEMQRRNIWFNFLSSEKNNAPGIRPHTNKLTRFNLVVPWFKAGKMYFPEEMKFTVIMGEFTGEIRLVTLEGIKGKDDCLDSISQLGYIKPWKPSEHTPAPSTDPLWKVPEVPEANAINSYIV
jgi:phage terminase large subunit-like protein